MPRIRAAGPEDRSPAPPHPSAAVGGLDRLAIDGAIQALSPLVALSDSAVNLSPS